MASIIGRTRTRGGPQGSGQQASKAERQEVTAGDSTSCRGIFYFQFLSSDFFFFSEIAVTLKLSWLN